MKWTPQIQNGGHCTDQLTCFLDGYISSQCLQLRYQTNEIKIQTKSRSFFKLRQGASSTTFVGPYVKKKSKKILQLENDLSEQILENEGYSGSWLDSKLIANHPNTTQPPTHPPLDKYVEDKIQFRPENKSFLTQCVNLKNV